MERMCLQQELYGSRFTASPVQRTVYDITVIPTIILSSVITTISIPFM
jgi:hypothetical protein